MRIWIWSRIRIRNNRIKKQNPDPGGHLYTDPPVPDPQRWIHGDRQVAPTIKIGYVFTSADEAEGRKVCSGWELQCMCVTGGYVRSRWRLCMCQTGGYVQDGGYSVCVWQKVMFGVGVTVYVCDSGASLLRAPKPTTLIKWKSTNMRYPLHLFRLFGLWALVYFSLYCLWLC